MKRCQSPTTSEFLDNIRIFIYKRPGWEAKSDERLKIEDDRAEKRNLQNSRPDAESFLSQINLFPNLGTPRKIRPANFKPNPQLRAFYHFSALLSITAWQNFRVERVLAT